MPSANRYLSAHKLDAGVSWLPWVGTMTSYVEYLTECAFKDVDDVMRPPAGVIEDAGAFFIELFMRLDATGRPLNHRGTGAVLSALCSENRFRTNITDFRDHYAVTYLERCGPVFRASWVAVIVPVLEQTETI